MRTTLPKSLTILFVAWTLIVGVLPVSAQDFVTSSDISGGSSVFVFRSSRKAKKRNYTARRRSKAKRTKKQRRRTRRKVVRQSKRVAKRYRKRRTIKKVTPKEFEKAQITLKRISPKEASKIFTGAAEYYLEKESNLDRAYDFLDEAVRIDPENKDAKLAFSELNVTLGNKILDDQNIAPVFRYKQALNYFDAGVKYDPNNALAYVGRGQVFDEQDEDAKARENYEKALELDPTLTSIKAALAYIYFGEGRIADADKYIAAALSEGEDSAEVNYFNGLIRYKKNENEAAEAALRKSISQDAENAEAHYYLGATLIRLDRQTDGINAFRKAIELDPKFVPARFDLGTALYNEENYEEAAVQLQGAIDLNTNNTDELRRIMAESYVNLAESYRQLERYNDAISQYRLAVAFNDKDPELFSTFGFVLGKIDSWKPAIENFKKAVELEPDHVNHANLGWAYMQSAGKNREVRFFDKAKQDLENAEVALKEAVRQKNDSFAAQFNLGVTLNALEKHDDAVDPLKEVLDMQKDWKPAVYQLGIAYMGANKLKDAGKQFERVLKKDKKFFMALYQLGKVQFLQGDEKKARGSHKKLAKLNKKYADRLETFFIQNAR